MALATFAGGCFWCTEAIFRRLRGVSKVVSGYTGGVLEDPTYESIHDGESGHAEAIQIEFDPDEISYKDLLEVFLKTHDPTSLNKQGADEGEEYRSAIFYHDESQRQEAEQAISEFQETVDKHVVTELVPFKKFYPAEDYHQEFYEKNPTSMYCMVVIDPKIKKLEREFGELMD